MVQRLFLDWRTPGLQSVAGYLMERVAAGSAGPLDLTAAIVVVPGGRAGRRLEEILLQRASDRGGVLLPEVVTLGNFPERLYTPKKPFADEFVQHLAWADAIGKTPAERLRPFIPNLPAEDDLTGRLSLAEMFARLHRELAADGLKFGHVADQAGPTAGQREFDRWQALAEVQDEYLKTLDRLGLWDKQTARLVARDQGEYHTDRSIVLAGMVDLNRVQRQMLEQVSEHVTALVLAPESLADRFDELGCLRPEAWLAAEIPIADDAIELVDDPADQAAAVLRTIAGLGGEYAGDEIAVGVPDPEVIPHLEQLFAQAEVPARYGAGRPIGRTSPYRLLAAAADYLERRDFASLAALVRHPALHAWLKTQKVAGDCLSDLDRFHNEHLPHALDSAWPEELAGRPVARAHKAVEKLLSPFSGERPLGEWGQAVLDVLSKVYGGTGLDPREEPGRSVVEACQCFLGAVQAYQKAPSDLAPSLTAADAVRLLMARAGCETVAPPPQPGAIELLGWLELPLDDAPATIITGFNEGFVPSGVAADLFLPNKLRTALCLDDNDRRYARDAYALSLLVATRRQIKIVVGRRSREGDPLAPSRLLFACDEQAIARRTLRLFSTADKIESAGALPGSFRPATRSDFPVPRPAPLPEPVASMRVTEFADYLVCPYRYYLRHRLRLGSLDDSAEELDGGAFGGLAHIVLENFALGEAASSTRADVIAAHLNQLLDAAVADVYGAQPRAVIRVQVEQLRLRLAAFAKWQAGWTADGWRIEKVEWSPDQAGGEEGDVAQSGGRPAPKAFLTVDGEPMGLRGRIDRIDRNARTGECAIFDYKTGDRGDGPEQVHRKRDGTWVNLQLPLYRHLAACLGIEGKIKLGYIVLPKDTGKTGQMQADWDEADLADADAAAAEIIRRVRRQEFWPPTVPPPKYWDEFAAIVDHWRPEE